MQHLLNFDLEVAAGTHAYYDDVMDMVDTSRVSIERVTEVLLPSDSKPSRRLRSMVIRYSVLQFVRSMVNCGTLSFPNCPIS